MTNYALVTGSTSGIGKSLAEKFASEKCNLILVSRNEKMLLRQANDLTGQYGITASVIAADLAEADAALGVYKKVCDLGVQIRFLVNNAGFNECGPFLKTNLSKEMDLIRLHIVFTTEMMKLFIPGMVKNQYGRVLNLGSIASFMVCPNNSVYAAAKAYVLSVSKGINAELKGTGVTVTALCPGATETEFARKAGMEHTLLFRRFVMKPERVADIGYKALLRGKKYAIAGLYNKLLVFASKLTPSFILDPMTKRMLK